MAQADRYETSVSALRVKARQVGKHQDQPNVWTLRPPSSPTNIVAPLQPRVGRN